jgi:hypothetical protein
MITEGTLIDRLLDVVSVLQSEGRDSLADVVGEAADELLVLEHRLSRLSSVLRSVDSLTTQVRDVLGDGFKFDGFPLTAPQPIVVTGEDGISHTIGGV